ncbi:MAG: TIGR00730 family Rossman fold protein [Elusimicrobia bacterium]|nr:TIGR00730 family Rossman fold protein [Elusimicrobiota bacterium]
MKKYDAPPISPELTPAKRRKLLSAIRSSPTYLRAYQDLNFLAREELRPIRFQLELLKPEMTLLEHNIHSTIVIFGSARVTAPAIAQKLLRTAEAAHKKRKNAETRAALARARTAADLSRYYEEARRFSAIVSRASQNDVRREYVINTGGGPGIMEAANRGAYEAGAKSIGMNITLPHEQDPNPYITPELCLQFHYFALRKMHMMMRAKALVLFPGGFGTLDEMFELLTLVQTGKKSRIPILLFHRPFWNRVLNFRYLSRMGVINPEDLKLFRYVETAEEAWDIIQAHYD